MDISFEQVKTGLLGSQPKILLVEDNFANRDMLADAMAGRHPF